jgi:transposase-like protein
MLWGMVTTAIACPHCQEVERVVRFGTNRSGTARCRCNACGKTFTIHPVERSLTPEKEAEIERALAERLSQRGIARLLKVSRDTVRKVRQKGQNG